ncbi:unnamed protein product [Arabis nemorensis]|uniref:Peptidase M20 dimerisation domain-containing protein n=1 Tax=Arabis nemorensis TaxID=586526 RepID=A0A565B3M6_9BRAS|nr:unnamed protein product [Arabis nemorensis]
MVRFKHSTSIDSLQLSPRSVPAEFEEWLRPPFSAHRTDGRIYAHGAQDDKCIGVQYLEAIKNLKSRGFSPLRTIHISYVPEEEIGGFDGQASPGDEYRFFYGDRTPWNLIIRAEGIPGHGAKLYDNGAMENLMKSVELIARFRETQFDIVKAGKAAYSEVVSINPVYLKAGTPSTNGFVMNMQPSKAEVGYDLRLPPMADPDIIEKGKLKVHLGSLIMTQTDDSNPWWFIFKQAVEATGGKLAKPEILGFDYGCTLYSQFGNSSFGFLFND